MPVGLQVFKNTRENYHITLFHTSKIWDPRPDATSPSGGVDSDTPPGERPPPTEVRNICIMLPASSAAWRRAALGPELTSCRSERLLWAFIIAIFSYFVG